MNPEVIPVEPTAIPLTYADLPPMPRFIAVGCCVGMAKFWWRTDLCKTAEAAFTAIMPRPGESCPVQIGTIKVYELLERKDEANGA